MPTTIVLRHITKIFETPSEAEQPASESAISNIVNALRIGSDASARTPGHLPEELGRQRAVDDVSLTVYPGETLGILGPSGCGKTTLLRIVAGLLRPTRGEVLYDGQPLEDIPPAERGIGMVFQNYALYPHLPSVDNIGFFLKLRKREQEIPQRVREISRLMRIDLKPLLSRKPPTLSGGEQQRVAIARCLARDPRVFLFDEPFSNLDAKLRTDTRVELKRLLQRYRITTIYVTHDQTEAIALADRIAIMREGRLVQIGTFEQLYNAPVNAFVAGFFGKPAMNLFPGFAHHGTWEGATFSYGPIRSDLNEDTPLILGVRPEHFVLDNTGNITAIVELIEPIYGERIQLVYTRIGSHRAILRLPLRHHVQIGEQLRLSIATDQVHLFDQESGKRLA